jgi:hypothetical protein
MVGRKMKARHGLIARSSPGTMSLKPDAQKPMETEDFPRQPSAFAKRTDPDYFFAGFRYAAGFCFTVSMQPSQQT